jgi:MFS family permease
MKNHPLIACSDFRKYFLGRSISAVGDKFYTIALAWWVLSQGENSGVLFGILMASSILPVVLFGPMAGTLADRMNRKKCMLIADGARFFFISVLFILCMFDWLSLPLLYLLVFLGFPLTFILNGFLLNMFSLQQLLIFNGIAVLIANFGFLVIPKYRFPGGDILCKL